MNKFFLICVTIASVLAAGCGPAQIAIAAVAGAGAGGGAAAGVSVESIEDVLLDEVPYVQIISGPVSGSTHTTPTFHWIASDIDGTIIYYTLHIDGISYGRTENSFWTTPPLSPGWHTFAVTAIDERGMPSAPAEWVWEISTGLHPALVSTPKTILLTAATVILGDGFGIGGADERPVHSVTIFSFWMAKKETTNLQFAQFLSSGHGEYFYRAPGQRIEELMNGSFAPVPGYEDFPAVYVSWEAANAYCAWLTTVTLETWRLPTEAEWEYVANAGIPNCLYPTGATIDGTQANFRDSGDEYETGDYPWVSEVGAFPSPFHGLYDMAGNVWEWCGDYYAADYYTTLDGMGTPANPTGPLSGTLRVLRGGSWNSGLYSLRCACRDARPPDTFDFTIGFRVAREN